MIPPIEDADQLDAESLDTIAWGFLCSEYTEQRDWDAPLDRRLDSYLHHRGLDHIVNDGTAYGKVLDRVMVNFKRARRDGVLDPPHV